MGNNNTRYITELSDDSSESESDFSIEPRSKVLSRNQLSHDGNIASNICIKDEDNKIIVDGNKDLTTDAAPKTRNSPKPEIVLTLEKVNKIEKELEQYEIISLVYLLYDDVHFALQELTLMLRGAEKQLLSLWVLDQESSHKQWQKKLIEALCIIKNYKILRELGYEKCNLIADLLPHRIQTLSSINKVKKAVYLICEKLDTGKTIMFLQNARLFLESQSESLDSYDYEYLELYFLKWEIIKFASPSDMNNIKKILKVMNEDCLYDMLCDAIPQDVTQVKKTDATQQTCPKDARNVLQSGRPSTSTDTDQHIPKNFDFEMESQILCPPQSLGFEDYQFSPPCVNQPSMSFGQDNVDRTVPDEYRYNIDPENPGVLLIINQENFYTAVGDEFKNNIKVCLVTGVDIG
ncbi:hypothetical protein NQ317_017704 [Molorchus minor]|uniref:Uncharacterized protein n=1 Tax=Molorchus minor TaxID=1323400 RepID=A0ABQ9JMU6_9CUCU|nr:hypothetical protein NQ317_017704 [Molorchus minor]